MITFRLLCRISCNAGHDSRTIDCIIKLPGYKRELRNGVCKFGMGKWQESEKRQRERD